MAASSVSFRLAALFVLSLLAVSAGCRPESALPTRLDPLPTGGAEPAWVTDAIFYQIFPERFANGDLANDPTRASLEYVEAVPENWQISPWTADWYSRADWEQDMGDNFYEHGVFHRRYGGDLQGVIDRLDYLRDLGINALYFNPLFYARSLHKYDGNTFHHIDPYFGPDPDGDLALMAQETSEPSTWHMTAADSLFFVLVDQAHQRSVRIVIDGVWNHTGRDFFAFADIRERQEESPYKEWYIINTFDDPATPENEFAYEGWWGVETLPLFADTPDGADLHPGPKAYIFDATRRWMDPNGDGDPSDGVDGWRLDVAPDVPTAFWADWNAHVRSLNPQAYTVSEVWFDASRFLQDGGFSATMNYHGFAFLVKGFLVDNALSASAFLQQHEERRAEYPAPMQYAMQNLIDSHDTDRLASMIVNARTAYDQPEKYDYDVNVSPRGYASYQVRKPDARERSIQQLVALMQMAGLGAPMIYYGTEAGMWGADDPDDRMPMVWHDVAYEPQRSDPLGRPRPENGMDFDENVFAFYKQVIALRNEQPALRGGAFIPLLADDALNSIAFARRDADDHLVVAINRSELAQRLEIPLDGFSEAGRVVFVTSGDASAIELGIEQERLIIGLPALTGAVVAVQ
ncbi:MAG: alpha-amylase family glycosyl hydrolase [Rhodothermales bacterium]|nr:alpha-amylase family glycosyl hydrolase [Rhodothermales bacterium]